MKEECTHHGTCKCFAGQAPLSNRFIQIVVDNGAIYGLTESGKIMRCSWVSDYKWVKLPLPTKEVPL